MNKGRILGVGGKLFLILVIVIVLVYVYKGYFSILGGSLNTKSVERVYIYLFAEGSLESLCDWEYLWIAKQIHFKNYGGVIDSYSLTELSAKGRTVFFIVKDSVNVLRDASVDLTIYGK